jgi:hypothetical protein
MTSSEPIVGYKRIAPDAPDNDDVDCSQPERGKEAEVAGPRLEQAEMQRNKKLRRVGEARNLLREELKMTANVRQIDEMERNEMVGEKRRSRDTCDARGEGTGLGLREEGDGAGGEKLENKRKKEATEHKQGRFQGKGEGKEKAVEKRTLPLSEKPAKAREQQHGEGVGSN